MTTFTTEDAPAYYDDVAPYWRRNRSTRTRRTHTTRSRATVAALCLLAVLPYAL